MSAPPVPQEPVLVIEDEPSVMMLIRTTLERNGYRVVPASSGVDGLRMLAGGVYRGIITDIRMPGGVSGADVHAWIAANRPDLAARIIFITGDVVSEETASMLERTGAPCVEKPFRVHQLLETVQKVFGKA
ncbi:MAG TPA: response regulator [Terriglobales bacterium]|nr:response regulator [Terriglobales bacterium]